MEFNITENNNRMGFNITEVKNKVKSNITKGHVADKNLVRKTTFSKYISPFLTMWWQDNM